MILHARMVAGSETGRTHIRRRVMRVSRRRLDFLQRCAADAYRVPGVKQKRYARALRINQSNVSRRMGGVCPRSPLGQVIAEAYALEVDGISSAFMVVEIEVGALMPKLRSLTLGELYEERRKALRDEAGVIAALDPVQAALLDGDRSPEMNRKAVELGRRQAAVSQWLVAICAEIDFRTAAN